MYFFIEKQQFLCNWLMLFKQMLQLENKECSIKYNKLQTFTEKQNNYDLTQNKLAFDIQAMNIDC